AHNLLVGGPAIGASDSIMGVVGLFVFWYAMNDVRCVYYFYRYFDEICISAGWLIAFYVLFDLWGALTGGGGVAYVAHLGGFAAGLA
ncbi:rhomboid family intramembrane serine protease, partial [Planococcus sp. SIMBA_160]